ncbi:hypothetical protein [Silvibacterium sp.]|uniref:hypothetical protein n=1 Tax=Silvibacterium sp. TaxID=1964179 RepID=UPI0039E69252
MVLSLGVCLGADAQQSAQQSDASKPGSEPNNVVPRVPGMSTLFSGLNAGFSYSAVHVSSQGWYELATPAVSYTFSHHYSADVSVPLYMHLRVRNLDHDSSTSQPEVLDSFDAGDTLMSFHSTWRPAHLTDIATASLTAPSGDREEGLGTGHVSFDLDNHTERYVRRAGFLLDLGLGNSSSVANNLVSKDYDSVGLLAHFQVGTIFWFLGNNYVESVAYEQLPMGSQTVYTIGNPNGNGPSRTVSYGNGASEDNGFTVAAGIPLPGHLLLNGYYNHSLRRDTDTVSTGITYVLHNPPGWKRLSKIDRALREAAGLGSDQP